MSTFNDHLLQIHQEIAIKEEDRKPYTDMCEVVKNWLLGEMCDIDEDFKYLFKGTELFGSHPNRVRVTKPYEFDVLLLFEFPIKLSLRTCPDFPGFVSVRSKRHWQQKSNTIMFAFEHIFDLDKIHRNKFQNWMQFIIKRVLCERLPPKGYRITHKRCCVAQRVYVEEKREPYRKMSIDFIPSLVLHKRSVDPLVKRLTFLNDIETFLAIPKPFPGCGTKTSRLYTFQLVNVAAERKIIWDKKNVNIACRLLKFLCDNQNMPRFKCHILTAIFLNEIGSRSPEFWLKPVDTIFFHMFDLLIKNFQSGTIPFYWIPQFNLLSILNPEEITKYTAILLNAYNKLVDVSLNKSELNTVASFFNTRYERGD